MTTATRPQHFSQAITVFKLGFAALTAGSRIVPLGDNGTVIGELAARTDQSLDAQAVRDPFRKSLRPPAGGRAP